ncbi:MAG: ATP-binding cassette domain-containing protein [Pseudomonadales bacterium]|nr:ATP-binding cassette domain-containing protein [Pseudomonadales bacterium]
MIEVREVRKHFGDVVAVRDISFRADSGQVTGLLGPNGAGKSTTLRMLYGLLTPDHGQVMVDGVDTMQDVLGAQSRLGVMTDNHGLYARLTAREHIHYFGRLHGMPEDQLAQRTDELIGLLDMHKIADRKAQGFSQGEKTKVSMAQALVHSPTNLILDEPTNGLDVMTTRVVRDVISALRDQQMTVLFSSHLMHEVAKLCDRIVIVSMGQVVAEGTTDDIRQAAGEADLEDAFVRLVEQVIPA